MSDTQIHHLGLTVGDVDRSVEFYTTLFGMEETTRGVADVAYVSAGVGVPNSKLVIAMLRGETMRLELIQYAREAGNDSAPRNNDIGAAHVCFPVEDIDATYSEFVAKGVEFIAPPSPSLGEGTSRFAYLRDPDGITVEILQLSIDE
ncbi:VOC family protein [Jiangella alkaliphila]|uniref:Catechol 2,3-dioxygenase n=1 Tax=Jiangella alkaliphila TaxID=419479 RepID=A0A1H2K3W7_9ACTN|nr:VOC family protein [Jiangella alkaliphila]SDU63397.1 Catechol 2,3-dioxygenase [Jiangella alkaliphila]